MADIEDLIKRRNKIEADTSILNQKAAVARAEEERISKEIAKHLTTLRDEFHCNTLQEAEALRDGYMEEIDSKLKEMEEKISALRNV